MTRTTFIALAFVSVTTLPSIAQPPAGNDVIQLDGGRTVITIQDKALINDTDGQVQAFSISANRNWIGVVCGPVEDVLRAHIELPDGAGIVIQQVIPDSPAASAGLEVHDVLSHVAGKPAASVKDLVDAISALEDEESLEVKWIRKGQNMSADITPVDRPDAVALQWQFAPEADVDQDVSRIKKWLGKFEDGQWQGIPSKMRIFGPGIAAAGDMPTNLNINIQKSGNQPAKIQVTRNNDTWEITEANLDQLPDDIRPHVESMLGGNNFVIDLDAAGQENVFIPDGPVWPRMEKRLDEMKRRMEEMHQQLEKLHEQDQPADDFDPNNDASIVVFRFDRIV